MLRPGSAQSDRGIHAPPTSAIETAKGEGCELALIAGKTSASVLFVPIESSAQEPLRYLRWSVGNAFARPLSTRGERILSALPGAVNGVWFATVQRGGDLHVYRLAADNRLRAEGTVHPEGTATTFSWATDGNGGAWLFLETISDERRFIEAFRSEDSKWRRKGIVAAGNLLTPRGIPGQRTVMCGQWIFSADAPPSRIPVEGQPDLAVTYPDRDGRVAELSLSDLLVRTSADAGDIGRCTRRLGLQARSSPGRRKQSTSRVMRQLSDGLRTDDVVIKRFSEGRWHTVLDTPVENVHGLSGPAVTIGNRLLFLPFVIGLSPASRTRFESVSSTTEPFTS